MDLMQSINRINAVRGTQRRQLSLPHIYIDPSATTHTPKITCSQMPILYLPTHRPLPHASAGEAAAEFSQSHWSAAPYIPPLPHAQCLTFMLCSRTSLPGHGPEMVVAPD